jgi:serine protease Do
MQSKFLGAAAVATVLAVTGFVGLRAAEHEGANPPATVKMTSRSEEGSHHGYSAVIKQVVPAVVSVRSTKMVKQTSADMPDDLFRQFFGDQFGGGQQFGGGGSRGGRQFNAPEERRERGLGSGVIVSPEGYILTNNHVVDGASDVMVTLRDNREFKARVIGTDQRTDIAVLKIDGSNFPTLTLADSGKVDVGDIVLAIGNPFGVGQTVTQGIVSATGRSGLGIEQLEDFIQTDAAINPGNSGGALVDDQGHLIGINTAIVGNSGGNVGIGFAVPINMAKHDMDSILAHGKVERGYLGVYPEDVTPALAKAFHTTSNGALIGDVTADSPAASAGLKKGDIVTEMNGQTVVDASQLRTKVGTMEPNAKVSLKVLRDGKPMDITVQLGSFPDKEEHASNVTSGEGSNAALHGVTVENLTAEIASQVKVSPQTKGVVVSRVNPSSDAAEAGLQQGDVVMEVNHQPVATANDFNRAVTSAPKDQPVLLLVNRGGNTAYIAIS